MPINNNNRRHRYLILLLVSTSSGVMSHHEFMLDTEYQYVTKQNLDKCKEMLSNAPGQFESAVIQSVSYLGFTSESEFYGKSINENVRG